MSTLNDMQASRLSKIRQLSALLADIAKLKESSRAAPADKLARIEEQAQAAPVCIRLLKKSDELTRNLYMRILSSLIANDTKKLLYARRIGAGSGSNWRAEQLLAERANMDESTIHSIASKLRYLRYPLLFDCLILAYLSGEASEEDLEWIVGLADIMQCENEKVAIVAQLAAAIMIQNKDMFDRIEYTKAFPWLSHAIPPEWIAPVFVDEYSRYKHILLRLCNQGSRVVQRTTILCRQSRRRTYERHCRLHTQKQVSENPECIQCIHIQSVLR